MEHNQQSVEKEVMPIRIGIDVGSTTVKIAVLDDNDNLIYGDYQRHRADIRNTIVTVITQAFDKLEKVFALNSRYSNDSGANI